MTRFNVLCEVVIVSNAYKYEILRHCIFLKKRLSVISFYGATVLI